MEKQIPIKIKLIGPIIFHFLLGNLGGATAFPNEGAGKCQSRENTGKDIDDRSHSCKWEQVTPIESMSKDFLGISLKIQDETFREKIRPLKLNIGMATDPSYDIKLMENDEGRIVEAPFACYSSFRMPTLPVQGFKVHVSSPKDPAEAAEILQVVLPILKRRNIQHKFVYPFSEYLTGFSTDEVECMDEEGKLGAVPNTQKGKFITIYPHDESEIKDLVQELDGELVRLRQNGKVKGQFLKVPGERQVGSEEWISLRYGAFKGDYITRMDDEGYVVGDSGRQLTYQGRKILVLNEQFHLIGPDAGKKVLVSESNEEFFDFLEINGGQIADDNFRGSFAPSWISFDPMK